MKTTQVKSAILNGDVFERNAWSISIDEQDNVLIFPPKGAGFKTSLGHIDKAVNDFCKRAEMPLPGVNQSVPPKNTSDTALGDDSSVGEGFATPSINKRDKPDGKKSPTGLGADTSTDEGFSNPSVIKRQPVNKETGGLPDTNLGSDSSSAEPDFQDKLVTIKEDGRTSRKRVRAAFMDQLGRDWTFEEGEDDYNLLRDIDIDGHRLRLWDSGSKANTGQHQLRYAFEDPKGNMLFSGDDYGVSPMDAIDSDEAVRGLLRFLTLQPGDTDEEYFADYTDEQLNFADMDAENMSTYSMDPREFEDEEGFEPYEFKEWGGRGASRANKIQDTFATAKEPDFYKEHRTPSKRLLEGIMDEEAWAANNHKHVAQYLHTSDPDRDMSDPHRQTHDSPPLVGYDSEVYEDFADGETQAECHAPAKKKRSKSAAGGSNCAFTVDTYMYEEDAINSEYANPNAEMNLSSARARTAWNVVRWLNDNIGLARDEGYGSSGGLNGILTLDSNFSDMELITAALVDQGAEPYSTRKGDFPFDPFEGIDDEYAAQIDVELSFFDLVEGQPMDELIDAESERLSPYARKRQADGFTPSKKTETTPEVSDPKVDDVADDDGQRKKNLDKATGYAFKEESKKHRGREQGQGWTVDDRIQKSLRMWESYGIPSEILSEYEKVLNQTEGEPGMEVDSILMSIANDNWDEAFAIAQEVGSDSPWCRGLAYAVIDQYGQNSIEDDVDATDYAMRDASKRQAGPKLREKWNNDDGQRKKNLDKATGYAFKDEAGRKRSFSVGDGVYWTDPDDNISSGEYTIHRIGDEVITLVNDEGSLTEVYKSEVQPLYGNNGEPNVSEEDMVDEADYKLRDARKRQAGPKLREKWNNDGGYNRDMEAESAEELYHMVRSFGSEDDYNWADYKPSMPIAPEGIEEGSAATDGKFEGPEVMGTEARRAQMQGDEIDPLSAYLDYTNDYLTLSNFAEAYGISEEEAESLINQGRDLNDSMASQKGGGPTARKLHAVEEKEAVDDAAKDYYQNYYKEDGYGKALTQDGDMGGSPRNKKKKDKPDKKDDKDTKKESRRSIRQRVKANIVRRDRRRAQQSQNPAVQPGGQNALEGAPLAPTSDLGGPPATGLAPTSPQAPATPGKPKGDQMPPGTGDSGLQALGWPPEDIQVMTDDDKQKILQIRLNKPGTQPPKPGEKPGQEPGKAPAPKAPPGGAPVPTATPTMPAEQPAAQAPAPIQARLMARRMDQRFKIRRAQQALETAPQEAPAPTGATPPAEPGAAPVAPAAAPMDGADMGGSDEQALQILQDVRKQEVTATDSVGVSIQKNQILAQRLMTELGMSMEEARKLYGVKDTSKLFQ